MKRTTLGQIGFVLIVFSLLLMASCAKTYGQVQNQNARRLRSGTASPNSPALSCVPGPPYTDIYIRTSDHSEWQCTAAPSTWTQVGSGGTPAPNNATYITETASSGLSAEFALGSLATGILKNTTTTGVPSIATGTDISTPVFGADAGASDTYAVTLTPALASYVVGTHLRFSANTANTGAASVNFNALGALTLVKVAGGITSAMETGDILAGQWVDCVIATGSNCQVQSTLGIAKQPLDSDLTTIAGLTATTDNVIQSSGSAWASRTPAQLVTTLALPYDVAMSYSGVPAASSVIRVVVPRAFVSGTSWAGSLCSAAVAATAQADFVLAVNGVTKLTLRFAAAGTTCSLQSPTSVTFVAGDVITVTSPGTPDATLSDVAISLKGSLP